jgi:hypothetical protein
MAKISKNTLFFDVAMSLDGFIAPEGMDMEHKGVKNGKSYFKYIDVVGWVHHRTERERR